MLKNVSGGVSHGPDDDVAGYVCHDASETMRRRQELWAEADAAEAQLTVGQGVPAREALAQIRQRHGL